MIEEKTPKYILELKNDLVEHIDKKIDEVVTSTAKEFRRVDARFDEMDSRMNIEFDGINTRLDHLETDVVEIKESIGKIEGHIGRYEVRATNIEQILLQDHKTRIIALEEKVFA